MRYLFSLIFLLSLNLTGKVQAATEVQVPALSSPVMDLGGFLNEAERADLSALAYEINTNNGPQITILTVPDMQGFPIEDFSIRVAEKWQLGTKEKDNGLLIVIAKQERQMRIEVGNGIEGEITDYDTAKYTREIFPEYFRRGEFHAVLRLFMEDVATRFNIKVSGSDRPPLVRRTSRVSKVKNGMFDYILPVILGILVFGSVLFNKRPMARGIFTGIGFSAFSGLLGLHIFLIAMIFLFGLILGIVGIGNFLAAVALSGGGRSHHGGGSFGGGGGGGWSGGGGGFSGGGSSGSW